MRNSLVAVVLLLAVSLPISAAPRRDDSPLRWFERIVAKVKRVVVTPLEDLGFPKP